jgi:hypothetical protein
MSVHWQHSVRAYLKTGAIMCRLPAIAKRCSTEAASWRQNAWKFAQNPGDAVAGDVGTAVLFAAELVALFKVGEFFGRGCTLFGYWP